MNKRNPFTLIELVIVVAVLMILISLVQPTLSRTLKIAKLTECISNLKHLAIGFQLYSENNDAENMIHLRKFSNYWPSRFKNEYSMDQKLFHCGETNPSDEPKQFFGNASTEWGNGGVAPNLGIGSLKGSYAKNIYLSKSIFSPDHPAYHHVNQMNIATVHNIQKPNLTPMVYDGSWIISWFNSAAKPAPSASTTLKAHVISRHGWSMNLAMADGSVNNHSLEDMWTKFYWRRNQNPRKVAPPINP